MKNTIVHIPAGAHITGIVTALGVAPFSPYFRLGSFETINNVTVQVRGTSVESGMPMNFTAGVDAEYTYNP